MEFQGVVEERYTYRKFDGRPVETSQLYIILETGRLTPTAENLQEQHIYMAQFEEVLAKLDDATPCRYGAATVVAVAFDKSNIFTYPGEKRDSGARNTSIVVAHMMLAAKTEGVDSCWINFFGPEEMAKELRFPENEEILMLLDLGYTAEGTKPLAVYSQRKEVSETISCM